MELSNKYFMSFTLFRKSDTGYVSGSHEYICSILSILIAFITKGREVKHNFTEPCKYLKSQNS